MNSFTGDIWLYNLLIVLDLSYLMKLAFQGQKVAQLNIKNTKKFSVKKQNKAYKSYKRELNVDLR